MIKLKDLVNEAYKHPLYGSDTEYWEVMNHLASSQFDAKTMCGTLCLQHKVNEALDNHIKGVKKLDQITDKKIPHMNFI